MFIKVYTTSEEVYTYPKSGGWQVMDGLLVVSRLDGTIRALHPICNISRVVLEHK